MIGLLGSFSLATGLFAAVASTLLWARAARGADPAAARQATWLMLLGAAGACAALEYALVTLDFSVRFVAENGSRSTPLYYRVTSLWSALDGSLLLWVLALTVYAVLLARRVPAGAERLHPWAAAVVSAVAVFFFALVLVGGHAFEHIVPTPGDGPGPNPLLASHPAMGVHPPLLYAGYVGMAIPFAYAVAALIAGDAGSGWLVATRSWALTAWTFLTAGIVLGAWWSYAVLGWGGYWAWDPVENVSLLPWLTTTALVHSIMVQRRRQALGAWNVALATAGFLLVSVGTFLTRSGGLGSVHAFTESTLGPMLLGFVVAVLLLVLGLLLWRGDRLGRPRPLGTVLSRETALLLNNLLLVGLAAMVLLGTLFPFLAQVLGSAPVSVGPPYFDRMAVPVALALLALMAVGPLARWDGDDLRRLAGVVGPSVAVAAAVVAVAGLAGMQGALPLLAVGLAAAVGTTSVRAVVAGGGPVRRATGRSWPAAVGIAAARRRRVVGGHVAHVGLALAAVAITASSTYTTASEASLAVGDEMTLRGVTVRLLDVRESSDDRKSTTRAVVALARDGETAGTAAPGLSDYQARGMGVSEPAIVSGWTGDVYLSLLEVAADGRSVTLRLAVNPLVGWLWAAGGVMVVGALLAGVPARRRPRPSVGIAARQPRRLPERVP